MNLRFKFMNRFFGLVPLIILITLTGFNYKAANTDWTIVSSAVTFKIKNAGFTIDGKFGPITGTITFDEAENSGNFIDAIIYSKTLNTGNDLRDEHIKKKDYFNVDKFPQIEMKATLFDKETNGTFKGNFKLTLKNKTKDVVVPFSFTQKDGKGVFKGTFTINRLDYGVGTSSTVSYTHLTLPTNREV